jgi:hypothetical protein
MAKSEEKPKPRTPEERLATLEERADWHRNIGSGIAGLAGVIVAGLLTWYIPKELASTRDLIKGDTAAQLSPINEKLARLTAIVELKQTKDVAQVIKKNVNFKQNAELAIKIVAAVAEQARAEGIRTNPEVLQTVNQDIIQAANSNPNLVTVAWEARLELVGYRTFLNEGQQIGPVSAAPIFQLSGTVMDDGSTRHRRQNLDNTYWRNFVFEDVDVEYDGGPMALENVVFIDCRFHMGTKPNPQTDKFANVLLTQNRITELFR